jgi:hypothetical protein
LTRCRLGSQPCDTCLMLPLMLLLVQAGCGEGPPSHTLTSDIYPTSQVIQPCTSLRPCLLMIEAIGLLLLCTSGQVVTKGGAGARP